MRAKDAGVVVVRAGTAECVAWRMGRWPGPDREMAAEKGGKPSAAITDDAGGERREIW